MNNDVKPNRIAIVGGGISGLAAAHRLIRQKQQSGKPVELHLFEANSRLGGVLHTEQIGDYLVEHAADMFITKTSWAWDLATEIGLKDQLIPTESLFRRSLVLFKGKPVPIPAGFTLLAPAKIGPVLTTPLFSIGGKMRMACDFFCTPGKSHADESIADFTRRHFGSEVLARLVEPLVGGIYTGDPEKLSLQATMPEFAEMERQHGSLIKAARNSARQKRRFESNAAATGARYGLFYGFKAGMSQFVSALANQIADGCQLHLDTPIRHVEQRPELQDYVLDTPDELMVFDSVILAVSAHQMAKLIKNWCPDVAKLLREIEHASSAVVVSGHKLDDFTHPLDAFGLIVPQREQRKLLAISFTSRKFPCRAAEGHILLRSFVGGAMQSELLEQSDEQLEQLTLQELSAILGYGGHPDFMKVIRYPQAMPQYHIGHLARVQQIEGAMADQPGLELAGNAFAGVGIPQCIHSGQQAADRILNHLLNLTPSGI